MFATPTFGGKWAVFEKLSTDDISIAVDELIGCLGVKEETLCLDLLAYIGEEGYARMCSGDRKPARVAHSHQLVVCVEGVQSRQYQWVPKQFVIPHRLDRPRCRGHHCSGVHTNFSPVLWQFFS